ncbi:MAG: DNA polymerase Y family protein [Pseudomonadota bacterium]
MTTGKDKSLLWASLYLPQLLLDDIDSERPLAIIEHRNHRQQIHCCNEAAQQAGIHRAMALNSAYALLPDLAVIEYDSEHESRLLHRIGEWAMQFSSLVTVHAPNHILIEIAGSKRLFESFEALISLIENELHKLGYSAQIGIAPTPLAANLLAKANLRIGITDNQRLKAAIKPLPVGLLELPTEHLEGLRRSGIHHIGNLTDVSPASLTRRFGCAFVDHIDRLLGRHPDPRTPLRLRDVFERECNFTVEVNDVSALQFATQRMIGELAAFLIAHDKGISTFEFSLHHERHNSTTFDLRFLHATSQARHLHRVLTERLAQIELVAPVCGLSLFADTFSDIDRDAADFFVKSRQQQKTLGEIVDKLSSRLGENALYTLAAVDDHRPEKAWKKSFIDAQESPLPPWPSRPLWLLSEPVPVTHSRSLTLTSTAERIETGWWDTNDVRRDYFIATDKQGARFWVYRDRGRQDTLFMHGIFA